MHKPPEYPIMDQTESGKRVTGILRERGLFSQVDPLQGGHATACMSEDMRLVKHSFWRWPTGRFSDLIHQVSALVITKQQWTQRHRIGTAAGSKSRKAFLDSGEFGARIPAEVLPSHPALYEQRDGESLPAPPPSHLTMAPASIS